MKISIVITTYNALEHVLETLNSIIQQTYSHYEIVLVDDGSEDETVALVKRHMAQYPDIQFRLFSLAHVGRAAALCYGMNEASYDWIAILDADDLWHARKLELQVEMIKRHQVDFLAAKSNLFYENRDINIHETLDFEANPSKIMKISLDKMLYMNVISHSSILMKKHLAKYSLTRKSQIDYELFLRLLDGGHNLFWLNQPLVYHRLHPGQSFESKKPLRYALSATVLQLKYCFKHVKFRQAFFVIFKLGYYAFLPRKIRILLREFYQSRARFNRFLSNH